MVLNCAEEETACTAEEHCTLVEFDDYMIIFSLSLTSFPAFKAYINEFRLCLPLDTKRETFLFTIISELRILPYANTQNLISFSVADII